MRKFLVAAVVVVSGWTVFAMTSGAQDEVRKFELRRVVFDHEDFHSASP